MSVDSREELKQSSADIIEQVPTTKLSTPQWKQQLERVFVYGWWRDGKYLYIGSTIQGIKRIEGHHVIGRKDAVRETDEFHFWYPKPFEVRKLEYWLITEHTPVFNKSAADVDKSHPLMISTKLCAYCNTQFIPTRDWARYCCEQHRILGQHQKRMEKRMVAVTCVFCKKEFAQDKKVNRAYCPICWPHTEAGKMEMERLAIRPDTRVVSIEERSKLDKDLKTNPVELACTTMGCDNKFYFVLGKEYPYHCETCRQQLIERRSV